MYNNGKEINNGAEEIMRRLMEVTNQPMREAPREEEFSRRSVHSIPEDREMYQNGNNYERRAADDNMAQMQRMAPPSDRPGNNRPPSDRPGNNRPPHENHEHNDELCRKMRLGYAYVKPQTFENLYDAERALKRGTLFKDLDLPKNEYENKGEYRCQEKKSY